MARLTDKLALHANKPSSPGALNLSTKRDVLSELPLTQIAPDPDQPRKDLGDLTELSDSIREMGVVQPIIVSIAGFETYRILAGERRFSAAKLAGLQAIPAIVRTVEDHERLQLQIIENLHRKDLTPFEEARAYDTLATQFQMRQEDIARKLGCSQESVSETLRLLSLPEAIQAGFADASRISGGKISRSLLLEIARRPSDEQLALWDSARTGGLTVRKIRATKEASPVTRFRYPIALEGVTVTLEFQRANVTQAAILSALENALEQERRRGSA